MKTLYTTDLHRCKWKYERLFNAAKTFGAEIVINGGDLLPKAVWNKVVINDKWFG